MNKYFVLIFISLLIGHSGCNENEIQQKVDSELLDPYLNLILTAKYNEAYNTYTSDFYKKHNSYDTYLKSYNDNISKRGQLAGYEKGLIRVYYSIGKNPEIKYEVGLKFQDEKYAKAVIYTITQNADGRYLLDAGWFNNRYSIADGLDGPF